MKVFWLLTKDNYEAGKVRKKYQKLMKLMSTSQKCKFPTVKKALQDIC